MIFTLPWALVSLAALPALAAIYLLRNRSRRVPVSSLMLWADLTRAREGGRHLQRPQLPWLLLLEIVILSLLAVGATDPRWLAADATRPLVVVLDDSLSMQAGGDDAPRRRALDLIRDECGPASPTQFILAGPRPHLLGDPVTSFAAARPLLDRWECLAPTASLDAAVTLAVAVGGRRARVLVLTDHPPAADVPPGQVVWQSLGRALPNVAITQAARSFREDQDRYLVELANFSAAPVRAVLTLTDDGAGASAAAARSVDLAPGDRAALLFDRPASDRPVHLTLADDALAVDNAVTLLPDRPRPVAVKVAIRDADLRRVVERALEAGGRARTVADAPECLLTDLATPPLGPQTWSFRFVIDAEVDAFVGPFLVDGGHPLATGLDLAGVIWAAGRTPPLPGRPVVTVGDVPLLTDAERSDGGHDFRLRFRPDLSNLSQSVNWPVLFWNLLQYRAECLPGVRRTNVRLGTDVPVGVPPGAQVLRVRAPGAAAEDRPVHGDTLLIAADRPGVYEVDLGGRTESFAANALAPGESDLRQAATGRWGKWLQTEATLAAYRSVAWLLMVAALGVLVVHLALAGRARSRGEADA